MFFRDFETQKCALVVNVASHVNNMIAPRLRLDVAWQYDIPIISEMVLSPDAIEYRNTVVFVELSELVNTTLKLWNEIMNSYCAASAFLSDLDRDDNRSYY